MWLGAADGGEVSPHLRLESSQVRGVKSFQHWHIWGRYWEGGSGRLLIASEEGGV